MYESRNIDKRRYEGFTTQTITEEVAIVIEVEVPVVNLATIKTS